MYEKRCHRNKKSHGISWCDFYYKSESYFLNFFISLFHLFIAEHLELLEKGELKSLYDTDQGLDEDEDDEDLDMNEVEELTGCEDDIMDERLSESEDQDAKPAENESEQYPVLNVADTQDLPEFNIEVKTLVESLVVLCSPMFSVIVLF